MLDKSTQPAAQAKVLYPSSESWATFYLVQLGARLSVMLADRNLLVRHWEGDSDCEKAVVLASMNNTCTYSLGSSRQQERLWAQCSDVLRSVIAPKFVTRCKCQSDFSSVPWCIPLTWLCCNKSYLNCDRDRFEKVVLTSSVWWIDLFQGPCIFFFLNHELRSSSLK